MFDMLLIKLSIEALLNKNTFRKTILNRTLVMDSCDFKYFQY